MAASRSHYPDPPLNPYESPGYQSYAQPSRSYQHPNAYDTAPLTNPPISEPAQWHLPERQPGRDGLPVFPARPAQPYVPRYMTQREAALFQSAPPRENEYLQGPGNLPYLDVPAYNPESRSYPYQPDTHNLTPKSICQRCGPNCLCNRPQVTASRMCQRCGPVCVCNRPQGLTPKANCQRCGPYCTCNRPQATPSRSCQRCGPYCVCIRPQVPSRPASVCPPATVANLMCPQCGPSKTTFERIRTCRMVSDKSIQECACASQTTLTHTLTQTKQHCPPTCRKCGALCACNLNVVGERLYPNNIPMSAPPRTSPSQVRNWMNLPRDAPRMRDKLYQFRQDHKISGYAGFFPGTANMLGGSIYRLTTNEQQNYYNR